MDVDWLAIGVGAVGGVAAFIARRAVASVDDLEESHDAVKTTVAVHTSELSRVTKELDDAHQRITATQLEVAAIKGKLGSNHGFQS